MRTLFSLLLLATPTLALASDPPKPNSLTEKQISGGWLLLFDGESTIGWTIDGDAAIKDGFLVLGGTKETTARTTLELPQADLQLDVAWEGKDQPTLQILGSKNLLSEVPAGKLTELVAPRENHPAAPVLAAKIPAGSQLRLRSVIWKPAKFQTLFNGKNLDGWKVNDADPKRSASKFTVTEKGELHVANGPGDLRTEQKFADFLLQFECKTNGNALNSGIFFRCIPDQYQNGYEAQIQNAFKDGDRTKPADFGTGAIYRRVPARKVISNDKEWFSMAVLAQGPHIATWVNGIPVVDWTDERKADDNPRKGLRTAAGHLSIQGHDPTTDILFRNFRIRELGQSK